MPFSGKNKALNVID